MIGNKERGAWVELNPWNLNFCFRDFYFFTCRLYYEYSISYELLFPAFWSRRGPRNHQTAKLKLKILRSQNRLLKSVAINKFVTSQNLYEPCATFCPALLGFSIRELILKIDMISAIAHSPVVHSSLTSRLSRAELHAKSRRVSNYSPGNVSVRCSLQEISTSKLFQFDFCPISFHLNVARLRIPKKPE